MELELGLKITKTKDDIDSISEYQLMKDTGPIFKSRETNAMFILIAHLKGYKRNCIDIKISKDGSKISISGEKPIQEMVMMGWVMQRKVVDVKDFNKVFKIPYGVNLDKIKGNYNEEEWILNIYMPKLVKGICGHKIEEVKEQEFDKRRLEVERGKIDHVSSSVGDTSQKGSKDSDLQQMVGSENNIEKMIDNNLKEINKETVQKEVGESKLRSEYGNGKKDDDDIKRDKAKCTVEKEKEESKLRIEDSKVKDTRDIEQEVGKGISQKFVDTSQRVFEGSMIQQSGDPKEKEVGEEKGDSKGRLKENVADHIPNNIVSKGPNEFGEPMVPQMEKTKSDEGKMNGGESKKLPSEANEDVQKTKFGDIIQKGIIRPKLESGDEDQECVKEKLAKEGFDDAKITINEEVDKYLPKKGFEAREGLNVQKMQETEVVKENVAKRKGKEIEYLVEKDADKRLKRMHVEAKKGNTKETTQKEIEEIRESGIKESGKQPVLEIEGSKGFNVAKEEDQREFMKEAFVKTQSFMEKVEGEESKERTKVNRVQDEEDKIDYGLVKLKGQGSRKLKVEPNEPFEEDTNMDKNEKEIRNPKFQENVDIGIFDGRKTQKFQEMGQNDDFKENGENIEKCMKKLTEDKYQKIQNEEIGNSKQKEFGELECETKDRLEESSIEPFDPTKASKHEENVVNHIPSNIGCINQNEFKEEYENPPFEAKEVVQKTLFGNIIKHKMETEDGVQECVGQKPHKEGFDANITTNEEFPKNLHKNTHEESGGLNVQKMQETKDVIENVVKRKGKKIEYLVEKSEGERLKRKHMEGKKGNNTREAMQEVEEIENGNKESGQQHSKENIVKEKSEVSEKMTEELHDPVENVNRSIEFNVAEGEEQKEVIKEASVESESLKENVEEEESKERTIAKRVEDEENKIEYAIVKLKGEGSTKLNVEPNEPFKGDTTGDKIQKDIINQKVRENVDIGIFDGRKTNKFQEMQVTEVVKEKGLKDEKLVKTVNGDKYKNIQNVGFKKNITKEKDDCYLQEQKSKDRSKEDFPMKMLDSPGDTLEGLKSRNIEKAKGIKEESEKFVPIVKREKYEKLQVESNEGFKNDTKEKEKRKSEEPNIPMKIKDQQCLQEEEPNDHEIEKAKKVEEQVAKRKSDEFPFVESTTKEEPQGSEIERNTLNIFEVPKAKDPTGIEARTPQRELQSARGLTTYSTVESIGFNEFEYRSAKDKKHNTKVLPPKFQNKETRESKDESLSSKKSQVGENCTHDITSTKEVESIEDKVVKPLSTLWFQSTQQSEVEERDKFCEGDKENYKGSIESRKEDPTKDIQNLIEMEETLNSKIRLEKELKKGEKGEFQNGEVGETMQMETDEPKNKIDTKEKQHVAKVVTEKMDKGKCFDEKMKTSEEKEAESLESSQKNDIAKMKPKRPLELEMPDLQCEFPKTKDHVRAQEVRDREQIGHYKEGTKEIKASKIEASEGAKPSKLQSPRFNQQSADKINRKSEFSIEEHKATKELPKLDIVEAEKIDSLQPRILDEQEVPDMPNFQTQKTLEEEKVVKRREEPKIANSEETKDASTFKREKGKTTQTTEEKKPKIKETTPQFDMASGSKRVSEKVHEAPKRECQRESEQVASTMEVEPRTTVEKTPIKKVQRKKAHELSSAPNMDNEISKLEEQNEKEGQKNNQVLEAPVSKEKEDRSQQYVQEKNDKKGFQRLNTVEEEKVMKKREGPKVTKSEERKPKMKEITPQFDKASGSKRVAEKIHETLKKEHQREIEQVTPKIGVEPPTSVVKTPTKNVERKEPHVFTKPPNIDKEIPKGIGTQKDSRVPKKSPPREYFHSLESTTTLEAIADKVVQKSKVPSLSCTQQFEVEEEEKTKRKESKMDVQDSRISKTGQEVEQCTNKDEEAKHVIEDKVVKPISAQRFQISQQSEVEENDKLFEGSEAKHKSYLESRREDIANDIQNLIEVKVNQEAKQKETFKPEIPLEKELKKGEKGEFYNEEKTMQERNDERKNKHHGRETKERDMYNEFKTTQNVIGEIIKAAIGKVDKEKCIHETTKASQDKKHPLKLEVDEKEAESFETSRNNDFPKPKDHVQVPELKDDKQHGSRTAYQGAKPSKLQRPMINQQSTDEINRKQEFVIEEHEGTKAFSPMLNIVESENIAGLQPQLLESQAIEDEEAKHGIEDIEEEKTYEQVLEEEKEGDETIEGEKDNAKIPKKLFVPMVLAGSAGLVTLVAIFVQHRRSRKR